MKKEIDKLDEAIGLELKRLRLERHFSMEEVALRVGCTKGLISFYESGRCSISIGQLIKICDVYNVKYYDVLEKVKKYAYVK